MPTIQSIINHASESVVNASIMGGVGYLCSHVCSKLLIAINPIHGAVYCAVASLVSQVINPIFNKFFAGPDASNSSKFLGNMLSITVGVGVSATIAGLAGFSIGFTPALYLTAVIAGVVALTVLGIAATSYAATAIVTNC